MQNSQEDSNQNLKIEEEQTQVKQKQPPGKSRDDLINSFRI